MIILVTNNSRAYENASTNNKFLISKRNILKSSFIDNEELNLLNLKLGGQEFSAADEFIEFFKNYVSELAIPAIKIRGFKWVENKSGFQKLYDLLYNPFMDSVFNSFYLRILLRILSDHFNGKINEFQLNFDYSYSFFDSRFYQENASSKISLQFYPASKKNNRLLLIKKIYYSIFSIWMRFILSFRYAPLNKKIVVFHTSSALFNNNFFKDFFWEMSRSETHKLIVVYQKTSIGASQTEKELFLKNGIGFYEFNFFRTNAVSGINKTYMDLCHLDPKLARVIGIEDLYGLDINYSWVDNYIRLLRADVVICHSIGETGRFISNTSALRGIKSICVEYSLFSDDAYWMESKIKFDARACIGHETMDLWTRRGDESVLYKIGFLRYDFIRDMEFNQDRFLLKYNLDPSKTTILFASTWGGENKGIEVDKGKIVDYLSHWCFKNKKNLIVKKHPNELDSIVDDIIIKNNYPNQVILTEKNGYNILMEAIHASDIISTQSSGIGMDALYFRKPFFQISAGENVLAKYSVLHKMGYAKNFSDLNEFTNFLASDNYSSAPEVLEKMRNNLIYENFENTNAQKLVAIINSLT